MEAPSQTLRPYVVLVVDDEEGILHTLRSLIARGLPGTEVLTTTDPHEGLRLARERAPDVVLSDHKMPGMLGLDFLLEVRRASPSTVRVMMTAFPEEELAVRAINDARIEHFFTKPFQLAEVLSRLREMLDERRAESMRHLAFARALHGAAVRAGEQAGVGPRAYPSPFRGPLS